jgi:hypothetical protein
MAERIDVKKVQAAVGKAVHDALTESLIHHGPIICGFVAPDSLPVEEAQAIADATARAVGPGAAAVVEHVSHGAEGSRAHQRRVVITGIRFEKPAVR